MMGNTRVGKQPKADQKIPAARQHVEPDLTDPSRTPGIGMRTPGIGILPEEDQPEIEGPTD